MPSGPQGSVSGASAESDAPTQVANPSGGSRSVSAPSQSVSAPGRSGDQSGSGELQCPHCQKTLGPNERFCPGCGRGRNGFELHSATEIEQRSEAAWREVQRRLETATAGRYEIVRELGRGGMAVVYLAQELALKREVAIKVMRPSFLLDAAMVDRFLREARTMASLRHNHIVAIHSVEEVDQLYFFVMQFVPGRPLDKVIGGRQLPVAAMQALIYQAATALSHAHRQGVIHRDIKPANIMLDREGNAIVTDFGIAKVADVQATSATVGQMGTPLYMSPEQCGAGTVTSQSDQYSLGNVAYEVLTGQPPFHRPTAIALGAAILNETPKPIRAFRKDCPPAVESAVLRMLAKKPEERFPTLVDAAAALGGELLTDDDPVRLFLQGLAKEEGDTAGRHLTPRPSKTRGTAGGRGIWGTQARRVAAIATVVGLVAVPLGYQLLRSRPSEPIATVAPETNPPAPAPAPVAAVPTSPSGPVAIAPAELTLAAGETRTLALTVGDRTVRPTDPTAAWKSSDSLVASVRGGIVSARAPGQAVISVDVGGRLGTASVKVNSATTAVSVSAAEVTRLLGAVRQSMASRDWERASDQLQRARALDPKNVEVRTLVGELARARAASDVAAVPPPTPSPAPAPQPAPPPPPAAPSHDAEIRRTLAQYLEAINARSLTQIRAIYPGLGGKLEKDWRDRFAREIKKVAATIQVRSIDESVGSARAVFDLNLVLEPEGASAMTFKIVCNATLEPGGYGWTIASLTERGA